MFSLFAATGSSRTLSRLNEPLYDQNSTTRTGKRSRGIGCFGLGALAVVTGCLAFWFSPIGRHLRYYGPAEVIVDELVVPFRGDFLSGGMSVDQLLALPKYHELRDRMIPPDIANEEIARFHMNSMFEIGMQADGSIHWHQDSW